MKKMKIDIPYYEDNTRISNSALGWFLKKGPKYLRDMLDGKEEGLKLPQLERGTMIHEYILQPDEFWKDYIILDFAVPKVKQQRELCELYYTYRQVDPFATEDELMLHAYNTAYSNKKSDEIKLKEAKEIIDEAKRVNLCNILPYASVSKGEKVSPGDIIGTAGIDAITGKPQLTFMVFKDGKPIDPATAPRA